MLGAAVAAAQDAPQVLERVTKQDEFDPATEKVWEQKFAEEPREDYFAQSSVLLLNKHIFNQNVYEQSSDEVVHWIVHFCVSWWEGCHGFEEPYRSMASEWHDRVNTDLLKNEVRFAAVDCAVDKVLCNAEEVWDYPTVNHYTSGAKVAAWSTERDDVKQKVSKLSTWLWTRLGHLTLGRLDEDTAAATTFNVSCGRHSASSCSECPQGNGEIWCNGDCVWKHDTCSEPLDKYIARGWKTIISKVKSWLPDCGMDMLVLLAAILGNSFLISRGGDTPAPAETPPRASGVAVQPASGEPVAGATADAGSSCVSRFLPEDWAQERKRMEL